MLSAMGGSTRVFLNEGGLAASGRRVYWHCFTAQPPPVAMTISHSFSSEQRNLTNFQPSSAFGAFAGTVKPEHATPWNWPFLPPGLATTSNLNVFFSAL